MLSCLLVENEHEKILAQEGKKKVRGGRRERERERERRSVQGSLHTHTCNNALIRSC